MKTEETIYQPKSDTQVIKDKNPNPSTRVITTEVDNDEDQEKEESTGTWKKVAIGGVMGIALGSGAVFAANKTGLLDHIGNSGSTTIETEPDPDPIPEATTDAHAEYIGSSFTVDGQLPVAELSGGLSFSEAFAAARSQVGAGGVFEWNGGVYGTYYANEWDDMSAEEKAEFGSHISYTAQRIEPETVVERIEVTIDQQVAVVDAYEDVEVEIDTDVQVLGVADEVLADGSIATIGHIEVEGQEVFLIDTDQDGLFEMAISDGDQNGVVSDGEYVALSESELPADNLNMTVEDDQYLASTGPDYINDDFNLA